MRLTKANSMISTILIVLVQGSTYSDSIRYHALADSSLDVMSRLQDDISRQLMEVVFDN